MNRIHIIACLAGIMLLPVACRERKNPYSVRNTAPEIKDQGALIVFPDTAGLSFFRTEQTTASDLKGGLKAPAKIAVTILSPKSNPAQNVVLFDNAELSGDYSMYLQHLTNIKQIESTNIVQRSTELQLTNDLHEHGAATGRDLLDAEMALSLEKSNLANEKASVTERIAKLTAAGFDPEQLRAALPGTVYIICDIPENEIGMIREKGYCSVLFTSFPEQAFEGRIDDIADVVDNITRMFKVRITLNNKDRQLKAGMYGTVSFTVDAGNHLAVSENALVTVEGKNYVFVRTKDNSFERKQVHTGAQVGRHVIINSGLNDGDQVVTKGVIQLKGLSFGY